MSYGAGGERTRGHFHKRKVHMRADLWGGGEARRVSVGLWVEQGLCGSDEGQVRGSRGLLVRGQNQEPRLNWSCSLGFFTQAPRPALWKALMSACLAEWYSEAACLASWYELGFSILLDKMDDS